MTVIVGLETTVGEKAVVLASDRLEVTKSSSWSNCLGLIEQAPDIDLSPYFEFLEEKERDKSTLISVRKIQISPDRQRALAHTGSVNMAHEQISELLLDTDRFLKNTPFLTAILFPIGHPKDEALLQRYIDIYSESFNLDYSLYFEHIPEVRRIFDIHTAGLNVKDFSPLLGFFAHWDRNYSPVLSEYLFAKCIQGVPYLFEITATGAAVRRQYYAKGSGMNYALLHLRYRLGTLDASLFCQQESRIEKEVDLEDAVTAVREAIEYANHHVPSCRGFDYVILRKDGIEPHFSDEDFHQEIDTPRLMEDRIMRLNNEIKNIRKVQLKYHKTKS